MLHIPSTNANAGGGLYVASVTDQCPNATDGCYKVGGATELWKAAPTPAACVICTTHDMIEREIRMHLGCILGANVTCVNDGIC